MEKQTARGQPKNEYAALGVGAQHGVNSQGQKQKQKDDTQQGVSFARLIFRELRNDDGHFVGIELATP